MTTSRTGRSGGAPAVSLDTIRAAAISLFGEKTYPVIGMRDLGAAVGILPGSLYTHIAGKEQLLLDIVESGITAYLDVMVPLAQQEGPADVRLQQVVRAFVRVLADRQEHTRVAFQQWTYLGEERRKRVVVLRQQYEDLFLLLLKDGARQKVFPALNHPPIAAKVMMGALHAVSDWYTPGGALGSEELADVLTAQLLGGLRA